MAKAVTLKNSNNEEVYPVTDASLVNGTIATGQIADGSVTPSKIDYSSMGPTWSGFYFSSTTAMTSQTVNVVTKKGTALTIKISNSGTNVQIISGAENITLIRQYWAGAMSYKNTGQYGVAGLASGSTVYTRFFGSLAASNLGPREVSSTASTGTSGLCYADMGTTSTGARSTDTAELVIMRDALDRQTWTIFGKIGSGGSLISASFEVKLTSAAGYAPTIYQRSESGVNNIYNYIEVLEP